MYLYIGPAGAHENACFEEVEMGKLAVIRVREVD